MLQHKTFRGTYFGMHDWPCIDDQINSWVRDEKPQNLQLTPHGVHIEPYGSGDHIEVFSTTAVYEVPDPEIAPAS